LRGDHERATALYGDGLTLSRELGGAQPLGDCLSHLGHELLLRGDHERAAALNEEAAALLRDRGYRGGLQFALDNLGWVALARGDRERAAALYEESLELCRELGDRLVASRSLEGLACVAGAEGGSGRAAKLFGAAQGLLGAVGYRQTPRGRALSEPYVAAARSRMGAGRWQAAFAEGEAMTLDEAVEYALGAGQATARPAEDAAASSLLSEREGEVLSLVAEGLTNPQVAGRLYLSPRTVGQHLRSIYRKLGVSSRAAAVREATERGVL
jgi:non-specific serine/threonine protein kinase